MSVIFNNVSFRYDRSNSYIYRGFNLEIASGQTLILVGNNGSGKSTFGHLLTGLSEPSAGFVKLWGIQPHCIKTHNRCPTAQFIPQKLWPFFLKQSARDELANVDSACPLETVESVLKQYSLEQFQDEHPSDLPDSVAWRLALAVGHLVNPRVLFIDEVPSLTSNLVLEVVSNLVSRRAKEAKITVIAMHRPWPERYLDAMMLKL